jgi:predicted Zn-dependent protease with MMP-like domain
MITPKLRQLFDREFEAALSELPKPARLLLAEVAVAVEDYPSDDVLRETGARRDELCGLYTGIPTTERSVDHVGAPSDLIHIYREGIIAMAGGSRPSVDARELRAQIRITLLHELGHYHGLEEGELDDLGY